MPKTKRPITFSRLYRDFARFQLGLPTELPDVIPVGEFTVRRSRLYTLASRDYVLTKTFKLGIEPIVFDLAKALREEYDKAIRRSFHIISQASVDQDRSIFVENIPFQHRVVPFNIPTSVMDVTEIETEHAPLSLVTADKGYTFTTFDSDIDRVVHLPGVSQFLTDTTEGSVISAKCIFEPVIFTNDNFVCDMIDMEDKDMGVILYPSKETSKHFTTPYELLLTNADNTYKVKLLHANPDAIIPTKVEPRFYDVVHKNKVVGMMMFIVQAD